MIILRNASILGQRRDGLGRRGRGGKDLVLSGSKVLLSR